MMRTSSLIIYYMLGKTIQSNVVVWKNGLLLFYLKIIKSELKFSENLKTDSKVPNVKLWVASISVPLPLKGTVYESVFVLLLWTFM